MEQKKPTDITPEIITPADTIPYTEPEPQQTEPAIIAPQVPYSVRLDSILGNPATIERMFLHLANGGDLISFCQMLDVRYSDVAQWITDDAARSKRFSAACNMGQEWVKRRILNELGSIGLVDIRGLLTDSGGLRDPQEWPDDVARAVQSIEVDDIFDGKGTARECIGQTKKVKLTDKLRALELIGKEIGMFIDRRKLEVTTKLEDLVGGSFGDLPEFDASGNPKPKEPKDVTP